MENVGDLTALAGLISQQVDQLWTIATAFFVAEIYLVCRFFGAETDEGKLRGTSSIFFLFASIASYLASLFSGYLSKGALINMVKKGMEKNANGVSESFDATELTSFLQFGFLALGLIFFVIVFVLNAGKISDVLWGYFNG